MSTINSISTNDVISNRHIKQVDRKVIVMAPTSTKMTSYHASGKSDGELYREAWRKAKTITGEFRL